MAHHGGRRGGRSIAGLTLRVGVMAMPQIDDGVEFVLEAERSVRTRLRVPEFWAYDSLPSRVVVVRAARDPDLWGVRRRRATPLHPSSVARIAPTAASVVSRSTTRREASPRPTASLPAVTMPASNEARTRALRPFTPYACVNNWAT